MCGGQHKNSIFSALYQIVAFSKIRILTIYMERECCQKVVFSVAMRIIVV